MRNLILVIFLGLDGVLSESRASRKRRVMSRFNCVFDRTRKIVIRNKRRTQREREDPDRYVGHV